MKEFNSMSDLSWHLAHEALQYLAKNGPTLSAKEVYDHLDSSVKELQINDELLGSYKNHDGPAYLVATNFKLVGYAKAGWIKKSSPKRGYWTITEAGQDIVKTGKDTFQLTDIANTKYKEWKSKQIDKPATTKEHDIDDIDITTIRDKIISLDPYDFQDLTAGLLEGMGYFVDFNAPKGKDGGVDLVCYKDPLGAQVPRIKIQCKHRPDTKISRQDISQFAGIINNNDEIGIYVTSGFFTSDAKRYSIERNIHIRLIDGQELEDMWSKYYEKIPADKKILLPLKFTPELLVEDL